MERFLPAWYQSVQRQTDQDFQLWIGLDGLEIEAAEESHGRAAAGDLGAGRGRRHPRPGAAESSGPDRGSCDGVVLVDSDDLLHPTRVAAARRGLRDSDVAGCALRLVDEGGTRPGPDVGSPAPASPADVLPATMSIGLSNSAFRSDTLRRCLPIPAEAALVDWFLVTRAWLCGATAGLRPRGADGLPPAWGQHGAHLAAPFIGGPGALRHRSGPQALPALARGPTAADGALPERLASLERVAADVEAFHTHVVLDPGALDAIRRGAQCRGAGAALVGGRRPSSPAALVDHSGGARHEDRQLWGT